MLLLVVFLGVNIDYYASCGWYTGATSGKNMSTVELVVFLGVNVDCYASHGWYTGATSRNNMSTVECADAQTRPCSY